MFSVPRLLISIVATVLSFLYLHGSFMSYGRSPEKQTKIIKSHVRVALVAIEK